MGRQRNISEMKEQDKAKRKRTKQNEDLSKYSGLWRGTESDDKIVAWDIGMTVEFSL